MKKDLAVIAGLFVLIVLLLIFNQGLTSGLIGSSFLKSGGDEKLVPLSVKSLSIDLEVASKPEVRKKGLSKRDSLPLSRGMLFVFENKGKHAIWMKDMKFAVDIIWIDENKRVVYMATNVAPEPGKKDQELARYRPDSEALYVLEVNAGLTALHSVQVGDEAKFNF